jgi:hypothetical protein
MMTRVKKPTYDKLGLNDEIERKNFTKGSRAKIKNQKNMD